MSSTEQTIPFATMKAVNAGAHAPLRQIVGRPSQLSETLECGHTIPRPLGLGEVACFPSKAKRRRCWKCLSA